jgi:hypothetical protein
MCKEIDLGTLISFFLQKFPLGPKKIANFMPSPIAVILQDLKLMLAGPLRNTLLSARIL